MLCTASRERKFCDHEMKIKQSYFLKRTNSPRKFLNVFVLKTEQRASEMTIKVHLCNVTLLAQGSLILALVTAFFPFAHVGWVIGVLNVASWLL